MKTTPTKKQRQEYLRQVQALPAPQANATEAERILAAQRRENLTKRFVEDPTQFGAAAEAQLTPWWRRP